MAYQSRVYRILIASPSDVEEEREIAVQVIQEWNDLHSYSRKVVLLPLRWETHAAPEYGTRPQEVINRVIVDECDLLIGIFWTRLGSPTGEADSGTLEEIARVGKACKPIMLYFSNAAIETDKLDLNQVKSLQEFKTQTYPNSLIETYKTPMGFRDKFSRQLELKIRDLQKAQDTGPPPLSLVLVSLDPSEIPSDTNFKEVAIPVPTDLRSLLDTEVNEERRERIEAIVDEEIKEATLFPLLLSIQNSSSSGVRSLYAQIHIRANAACIGIAHSSRDRQFDAFTSYQRFKRKSELRESDIYSKLAELEGQGLRKTSDGWHFSLEWDALQPQRSRLIKPILFVRPYESAAVLVEATVFADSFPHPVTLKANLDIRAAKTSTTVSEIVPNLEEMLLEKPATISEMEKILLRAKRISEA